MPDQQPSQPRNVHIFGVTSFLNDTASEMAYWILPAFLVTIGAGPATLGIIEGIAESVASFAKLFSGFFADRIRRRKPLVVGGYVVANAVKPLLGWATGAWQVLLIRFSDRFAKGVRGAPRDVMLAGSVPASEVGGAFGLLQAMDSAGAIAGPLLALAIMASSFGLRWGARAVFWAAAVPGLLCILVVAFGLKERAHDPSVEIKKSRFADPRVLPPAFWYVLVAIALFSIGNSSDMFLVLRAQSLGIPASHTPLIGLVFNITYTLFSWPAGRLSDRVAADKSANARGRYSIVAAGLLIFAATYASFAHGMSHVGVYVAMAFYGIYYALTAPVLKAVVVDAVPREHRGGAFGIFDFSTSVCVLLASTLTGLLWRKMGPAFPFHVSSVLALIAAVMVFLTPTIFSRQVQLNSH
jgi:MFS family permease